MERRPGPSGTGPWAILRPVTSIEDWDDFDPELDELETLSNSVVDLLEDGALEAAAQACHELKRSFPDQIDWIERTAMVHAGRGEVMPAVEHLRRCIEFIEANPIRQEGHPVQTKVQKWGNSLALRIPRSFAAEARVEAGSTVDVSVENGCLRVRPVRARRYVLRELLKKISSRNVHGELDSGRAVGREAW